jgi:gliding motility-associated-like protein
MKKGYILFLILAFLGASPLSAKHIIGGVLTYECLGGGTYRFTMRMYRDCSDPTGAGFDFNAPFSIYKGSSTIPLTTIFQSPQPGATIGVPPPDGNPCLQVPADVCVQETIYSFNYTFSDWPSTESYHISYQRCCRNNNITNVINPEITGATFTVEILPASQELCNNSPVFEALPPTVICAGEPLQYFHTAFDAEGDQLIYELCAPLQGAGPGGSAGFPGPANACDGLLPNPVCPPPYNPIQFFPPYTPLNPLGGSPPITIDPNTGLLSGTPTALGQYVVGVCVSEYRNGVLLSTIRRDFQFNIGVCEPTVQASLVATQIPGTQGYLIRSCSDEPFTIENNSTINPNIDQFIWEFYLPDTTLLVEEFNPTVDFLPGTGLYTAAFIINGGSLCGDTAALAIEIFPEIDADFNFQYDTCVAGPVFFTDASVSGGGEIVSWSWSFGDGGPGSNEPNPFYQYTEAREAPVQLTVTDVNGCVDSRIQLVRYFPVPALILVSPSRAKACPPQNIIFANLSSPIDDTYQVFWDFGDGGSSEEISPEHTYLDPGTYSVLLEITSPIGCFTDTLFSELIEITEPPLAGYSYNPETVGILAPSVQFTDESERAALWEWRIDGRPIGNQPNLSYVFPDTGQYEVTLLITHPQGCIDSLTRLIDVIPEIYYYLPNAFTPNSDDLNDQFMGAGYMRGATNFRMDIWNRWGELIYWAESPSEGWNGQRRNDGRLAPPGQYFYRINFIGPRGEPFSYEGWVTLMN